MRWVRGLESFANDGTINMPDAVAAAYESLQRGTAVGSEIDSRQVITTILLADIYASLLLADALRILDRGGASLDAPSFAASFVVLMAPRRE